MNQISTNINEEEKKKYDKMISLVNNKSKKVSVYTIKQSKKKRITQQFDGKMLKFCMMIKRLLNFKSGIKVK